MKKILATVLALAMVFSLSVSALAAPVELKDAEDPSQSVANPISGSVEVTVNEGVDTGVVYSVTVAWDDTSVVYQKEGKGTWNPSTHEYDNATEDGWTTNNTASVTVTNHSNAAVTATIATDVMNTGTTYTFSDSGTFNLATAEGTLVAEAPKDTFTITAGGTPTAGGTDTFNVTITAVAPVVPETINLTFKDDTTLHGKNSSLTVLLPDGYTNTDVTYEMRLGNQCGIAVEAGSSDNELLVTHPGVCGTNVVTLVVTSIADPSITGTLEIECVG